MDPKIPMTKHTPEYIHLLAYIKGNASSEIQKEVEDWLHADDSHESILLDLAKIYFADRANRRMKARNPEVAYEAVLSRIKGGKRIFWLQRVSMVAACLLFFVLGGLVVYWMNPSQEGSQLIIVNSNAGMRTRLELPDGTKVCLNSESRLTYPSVFHASKREVTLLGEAYFEVDHQPSRPFVVHMADDRVRIQVLGTTFNAQAYSGEDRIETTLVEGKVILNMKDQKGQFRSKELYPFEKLIVDVPTGRYEVKKTDPSLETAWIDGKLIFKNTPLPEVLRKIAYFYNVKFTIEDPVINSYRFTGTFINRQFTQILDYLKISSGIDYAIQYATEDDSHGTKHTSIQLRKRK